MSVSKNICNFPKAMGISPVTIRGSFRPKSTGSVSGTEKGIGWSVARTSQGLFTVTFDEVLKKVISARANFREADGRRVRVQMGDYSAANRTLQIRVDKPIGHIPLDITAARHLTTNDTDSLVYAAGPPKLLASVLSLDSDPTLKALTGGKEFALSWAASSVQEIMWQTALPADFDESEAAVFKSLCQVTKAGGAIVDHVPMTVQAFFGVNGTDAGGDTNHITTGTPMLTYKALTQANQTAAPNSLCISVVPTAHTTDSIEMIAAWLEYTRKLNLFDPADDADNEISFEVTTEESDAAVR